ncbi:unannotated protein [freshwater metagenome]|uniref:Unannotated protein n=1 Tax=freshwater metagenome TaxID=449393 RepID=A0A6J6NVX9_9ZZZZ
MQAVVGDKHENVGEVVEKARAALGVAAVTGANASSKEVVTAVEVKQASVENCAITDDRASSNGWSGAHASDHAEQAIGWLWQSRWVAKVMDFWPLSSIDRCDVELTLST